MSVQYTPETTFGVYAIENTTTGACYIGCTAKPFAQRWGAHRSLLIRGKHYATRLQADWDEYGSSAFRFYVVEQMDDAVLVSEREEFWIRQLRPVYNAKTGYRPGRPTKKSLRVELRLNADDAFMEMLIREAEHKGIPLQQHITDILNTRHKETDHDL